MNYALKLEELAIESKGITDLLGMLSGIASAGFESLDNYATGIDLIHTLAFENSKKIVALQQEMTLEARKGVAA